MIGLVEITPTEQLAQDVTGWLETWAPHCGASSRTFEGQFRELLARVFDNIETRAEGNMLKTNKLEGMHYAALKDVRSELRLRARRITD